MKILFLTISLCFILESTFAQNHFSEGNNSEGVRMDFEYFQIDSLLVNHSYPITLISDDKENHFSFLKNIEAENIPPSNFMFEKPNYLPSIDFNLKPFDDYFTIQCSYLTDGIWTNYNSGNLFLGNIIDNALNNYVWRKILFKE